jgi:hypothetical protein
MPEPEASVGFSYDFIVEVFDRSLATSIRK